MKQQAPTAEERVALERIEALQTQFVPVLLVLPVSVLLLQLLPERYSAVSTALSVALFLIMLALLLNRTCFLRCPRCSGWIVIPKCPGCGLKLDKADNLSTSANR